MRAETGPPTPDAMPGPVAAGERLRALDTLRGVAVLGILVMNVYAFAMPSPAYMNPLLMGGREWYNLGTWFVTHLLADQKFMTIFSMLFGAGTVLMWERAAARGAPFGRLHYRRMGWLLLLGMLHGYLLWFGDILFHYALIGMLVYPARRLGPRTLIVIACLLLPVAILSSYGSYAYVSGLKAEVDALSASGDNGRTSGHPRQAALDEWRDIRSTVAPSDADIREDLAAHRGGYADLVAFRAPIVASLQLETTIGYTIWRTGGLMLLGMALLKLGVLGGRARPATCRKLMLAGYGLGLPLALYSCIDLYAHGFDALYLMQRGGIANYLGSILVALGHVGLVMRIVQRGLWPRLADRLAAVGRLALSNYLLQSLVMTTLFYGYGLGLYGEVPRAAQMLIVAAMLALQLAVSPWWLERFRFGPAEWLWRSLTYRRRQPLRR